MTRRADTAYRFPVLQQICESAKSGFDPKWRKTENVTVYILVPSEHVQTAAPWLNLIIGLFGESVGRAGKARPVTFLFDELPALGFLPDLRTQMRQRAAKTTLKAIARGHPSAHR